MSDRPRIWLSKTAILLFVLGVVAEAGHAQLERLREAARNLVDRVSAADEFLLGEQALTTGLADTYQDVPALDSFDPANVESMLRLKRGTRGGFLLRPGVFELEVQSYCLRAGTYGSSGGRGYLPASFKGPRAGIIRSVLRNSADHPDISQQDIQVLLWAILSRAKLRELSPEIQIVASRLLSPEELLELSGYGADELRGKLGREIYLKMPSAVREALKAEEKLRHLLTSSGASFRELERIAVLSGEPELGEGSRGIPWGRWSAHPQGFYVRYLPSSYHKTRIQVYLPVQGEEDIAAVRSLKLLSHPGRSKVKDEFLTDGPEFDPSSEIAMPANTSSQRLGQSARPH